jgi:hypothetical protein
VDALDFVRILPDLIEVTASCEGFQKRIISLVNNPGAY